MNDSNIELTQKMFNSELLVKNVLNITERRYRHSYFKMNSTNEVWCKWSVQQMKCAPNEVCTKWSVHQMKCATNEVCNKWSVQQMKCATHVSNKLFSGKFVVSFCTKSNDTLVYVCFSHLFPILKYLFNCMCLIFSGGY